MQLIHDLEGVSKLSIPGLNNGTMSLGDPSKIVAGNIPPALQVRAINRVLLTSEADNMFSTTASYELEEPVRLFSSIAAPFIHCLSGFLPTHGSKEASGDCRCSLRHPDYRVVNARPHLDPTVSSRRGAYRTAQVHSTKQ